MKTRITFFAFILFCICTNSVLSQDSGRLEDLYLKGKWNASCATEILSRIAIQNCELCSFITDAKDHSKGFVQDFVMDFTNDSIKITKNNNTSTVPYIRDKNNHSFSFSLDQKDYKFRVFLYDEKRIIEDNDGLLVILERKE